MSYNDKLRCDNLTTNHEGAAAWRMTPEWELYTTVVTTMGTEDKFYEDGEARVRRIADLVRKTDPVFVAQLAVHAREAMHLRSVPLLLLVELDRCHQGDSIVSRAVAKTVQRADEIAELLMCYLWRTDSQDLSGLSRQLRNGLAEAFNKFDEYQFAKYDRKNRKVTLRDALLLVHPKPKDERQAEIFRKIRRNTLETPYTWETELSAVGQRHFDSPNEKEEAKREAWRNLVGSRRLGYMATLRNLMNMVCLNMDEETMGMVCNHLANPDAVRRSRLLPFRFLAAYTQLTSERKIKPGSPVHHKLAELDRLQREMRKLGKLVEKMKQGYFLTNVRVVKRFYDISDRSVFNIAVTPEELGYRPPMRHFAGKARRWKHFDHPSEKNLQLLERTQKQLLALEGKEKELSREMDLYTGYEKRRKRFMESPTGALVLQSLETAASVAAENIPGFTPETRVLLASDTSGSMCSPLSENSTVMYYHIGLLLSMLVKNQCPQAVTGMFATAWKEYDMPSDNVLQNTVEMVSHMGELGLCTNGHKVIDWLIENDRVMDKVMLFTDMQLWCSEWYGNNIATSWDLYKIIAPDARLYLFDLTGYGQSPVNMKRDDVFFIAGWSDKVFDILATLEKGKNAIDEIRRIVV